MARKAAPGTLIHCDACGEDYSATYKRCPFCGEKPEKWPTAAIPPVQDDYADDGFVFDGGDVFDDETPDERPARQRGGKRLAQDDAPGPINWPRLITFICSLIIIAAALVIVFSVIYPKIHNPGSNPGSHPGSSVSPSVEPSVSPSAEPSASPSADPSDLPTDDPAVSPSAEPSTDPTPSAGGVTGLTLDKSDFTLPANESWTIHATVTPADWSGDVNWSSSNTNIATVDFNGKVTNVNSGSSVLRVTITAEAGGQTATCTVYCSGGSSGDPTSRALSLNRSDFTLYISENQTFTMKATGADSVTWSIGDSRVAIISDSGLVTPQAPGQTTITCTASDGRTATCIVRVKN